MGVGSEGQGGRGLLDFYTWYKYTGSRLRLKSAIFGLFFVAPPPLGSG